MDKDDEDFVSKLDRLVEEEKRRQYFRAMQLKIAESVPKAWLLDDDTEQLPVERMLREAGQLICEERFKDALKPLTEVLKDDSSHPESLYLMAYCHFNLKDDMEALRILSPLRGMRLNYTLTSLVEALRIDIRRRLLPSLPETILSLAENENKNAIFEELAALAPNEILSYFVAASSPLIKDRHRETMVSADIFISYAEKDGEIAVQLAIELESHGYTTWYYDRDSRILESWIKQICQAIDGAVAIAIVISPNCFRSYEMDKEIIHAHKKQKRFIPILCGLSHAEFQEMKPEWDHIFGSAPSIRIPPEGVTSIISNLIKGLKGLDIVPVAARPKEY